MRKRDKLKVIQEANSRLEREYLKSKGLLKENDDLEWVDDSLKSKEGFDWLRYEPLDNLIGLQFEWDGNLYEITSAFDASEMDEDDDTFEGPYGEGEEGIWIRTVDPETGEDYEDSIPLDAVINDLEGGIATLIGK